MIEYLEVIIFFIEYYEILIRLILGIILGRKYGFIVCYNIKL